MRDETGFNAQGGSKEPRIGESARKVGEGLGELGRALRSSRESLASPAARFIQDQPLAALGLAFGLGYVLGGGMFTKATGRLLGLGWRFGGMALAKSVLGNLGVSSGEGI